MIEYSQSIDIPACRLSLSALKRLDELIDTDLFLTADDSKTISTSHEGIDISEDSLSKLLAHEPLPRVLRRLQFTIYGRNSEKKIDRSLNLSFYENHISLRVSGMSQNWVLGKSAQIRTYLMKHRTGLWFMHTGAGYAVRGALAVLEFISLLASAGAYSFRHIALAMSLFGTAIALAIFLTLLGKSHYVTIELADASSRNEVRVNYFTYAVGIATIIGTLASIIALLVHSN